MLRYRELARSISDANLVGVDFLINDARIALTFLDLAETTKRAEDRVRRVKEARQAYNSILFFLPRVSPSNQQREVLAGELEELKKRLRKAGVSAIQPLTL